MSFDFKISRMESFRFFGKLTLYFLRKNIDLTTSACPHLSYSSNSGDKFSELVYSSSGTLNEQSESYNIISVPG